MTVKRIGKSDYEVNIFPGEPFCGHCPSVEVMMNSVAEQAGSDAIGIMLTGMGNDGAGGMLAMRLAGAHTIAQDEKSCVVFGMPWEAYKSGGAERLVPLDRISGTVINLLLENNKVRARGVTDETDYHCR
jgi:two-component system chemotaxis response regulator CheB